MIDARFQMVAGGDLLTPDVVSVPWQRLVLYPAGWYARNIPVAAAVKMPEGLRPFTSLTVERTDGPTIRFRKLRERSGGRRGFDDFARRFFAGASPTAPTRTYTFEDICRTLNDVAPADWAGFLRGWIDAHAELDTTSGLARHGWRLVYTDVPTAAFRASEDEGGVADLTYSIGLTARDDGAVRAVAWEGPAFRAGMRPGARIVAVNATRFGREALLAAVQGSAGRPIVLTVEQDGRRSDLSIPYAGKLRYPRLDRIADRPDTLATLLAPR